MKSPESNVLVKMVGMEVRFPVIATQKENRIHARKLIAEDGRKIKRVKHGSPDFDDERISCCAARKVVLPPHVEVAFD